MRFRVFHFVYSSSLLLGERFVFSGLWTRDSRSTFITVQCLPDGARQRYKKAEPGIPNSAKIYCCYAQP